MAKKSATIPSAPDLEALIASDPRDEQAWSVLEDWLLETDDPRADIVRAERAKNEVEIEAAYDKVRKRLLGAHPKWIKLKNRMRFYSTWRAGHIVRLGFKPFDEDDDPEYLELYKAVLATPAARLVSALNLQTRSLVHASLAMVARSATARSIRDIYMATLVDGQHVALRFDPKHLAPFHIETFDGRYSTILLPGEPLAHLRSLTLGHEADPAATATLFASMAFPELHTLDMYRAEHHSAADLAPLLAGTSTPKLTTLRVQDDYNNYAPRIVTALRSSQLLRQLTSLELGYRPGSSYPESQVPRVEPGAFLGAEFAHLAHLTVPRDFSI